MGLNELESLGLVEPLDTQLARVLGRLAGELESDVELAIALTSRSVRGGHSCFPLRVRREELWPGADRAPSLPERDAWLRALSTSALTTDGPLVLDDVGRLYLRRYWQLEQDVAAELSKRAGPAPSTLDSSLVEGLSSRLFPGDDDSPQRRAATNALRHRVSLLCGGPGTGKTTTVASILALLVETARMAGQETPRVMLLAPTGKSASRLAEAVRQAKTRIEAPRDVLDAIPDEARTIHRALQMRPQGFRFGRDAGRPLEADIIVVDEASMIDLALMRQLLDATPPEARLLIVGDPDQLTSVEAGSVLRDLVAADEATWWTGRVTRLTTTYRFDSAEPMGRLIDGVRRGDAKLVDDLLQGDTADVVWRSPDRLSEELDRAAALWSSVLAVSDPNAHFEMRQQFVILTPFRVGPVGTRRLGEEIRRRLTELGTGETGATPIIIEQNSNELKVYNGDFGLLLDEEPPAAVIRDDRGEIRTIAASRLPRYSEAFALSVHKSQGSELDEVLIVLPDEDSPLLTRELLYTAVSRARRAVRLVGTEPIVAATLGRSARRYSGLVDAIANSEHSRTAR